MIELALGDIFDLQQGFAFKSKDFLSKGVPILKIKNVKSSGLSLHQLDYVNEAFLDTHRKYIPERGDALISMSGNRLNGSKETWVGKVALFKEEATFLVNQRVGILKNKIPQKANTGFLVYALSSDYWQLRFAQTATSSGGQANLSTSQILRESVLLPSWSDQKAIAHILGSLDDKIELNHKMNQTLEEIAKAIFKSWFVDFDPVRAKAEGRPTGLPPEISDLFPDELVDSEIGEIPKGWDIKSAESLFDITIGRTPPRKEAQWFSELETDVPWVSIRDMGDCGTFISKTSEYLTHDAVSKHRMRKLPVGSVLVSFKLTVGRVAITTKKMTTNEAIAHFPPSDTFPYPNFAYFYLKGFGYEALGSTSSIATAVNSKMIKAIPFIVATSDLTEKFEETVAPMMERIRLASEETHVLSELRDTLLPKLISGELRIPDAEKFLEEAGI